MFMFLDLAWRNIWRNKRRSLISIASVLLAVVVALLMRSMQKGTYANHIRNTVSFYTGYIQLHEPGYFEKQSIDKSIHVSDSLVEDIENIPHVTFAASRLESFALISGGSKTDVGMIVGVDPRIENRLTSLEDRLVEGKYLGANDNGILLAEGLARDLGLGLSDTVVLLGQGYHDIMAAGKFPVTGILKFPLPDLNNRMAYLTLKRAQQLFGAYDRITSLVIMLDGQKWLGSVMESLKDEYDGKYEVISWRDMMPEVVQAIEIDNASGIIMLIILYMVIGFGILGTILMMTMERIREFGMMMAVGMARWTLQTIIIMESIILSFVGVVTGSIVSIPVLLYFFHNPIRFRGDIAKSIEQFGWEPVMNFSMAPNIFFWQAVAVLIIALIASFYPVLKVSGLEPVKALRSA
jgi:ABC-type lipoprotein release transport system permease subunit